MGKPITWMRNLWPILRLAVVLVVALAVVSVSVRAVLDGFARVERNARETRLSQDRIAAIEGVLSAVKDVETGSRGYVITGDSAYLAPYETASRQLDSALGRAQEVALVGDKNDVDTLVGNVIRRQEIARELVRMRRDEGVEAARLYVLEGGGKSAMDTVRQEAGRLLKLEALRRQNLAESTSAALVDARNLLLFSALGNALLLLGVFGLLVGAESQRAKLEAAYADVKRAEEMRESLTAMLVHDLRTPLTTLLGPLQMIQDDPSGHLDDTEKEILAMSISSGERLLRLINELLDIAKMEAGELKLKLDQVRPGDVLEEAVRQVKIGDLGDRAPVRVEVPPDIALVSADGELLTRVLVNLLGNALKFTPLSGQVTTGAVRSPHNPGFVRFFVRDTGEGIPKEDQAKIFDKFGQVETRKAGRKMSTGLGLTFCKLAVESHHGRIWVESEPGQGSTFLFEVPVRA